MTAGEFFAHLLMSSRNGRAILKVLEIIAFFIGMICASLLLNTIDTKFFPVITDWKIDFIERRGNQYHMGGVMIKRRACELIATEVVAVPKIPLAPRFSLYRIKPYDFPGAQVPTGFSRWGPWDMDIPAEFLSHRKEISFIEVVGVHRCHAAWLHETVYGRIQVENLP